VYSKCLGLLQKLALFRSADRYNTRSTAFGPGVLEGEQIPSIRPGWLDLYGFLATQAEGRLQPQGHGCVGVAHLEQLSLIE